MRNNGARFFFSASVLATLIAGLSALAPGALAAPIAIDTIDELQKIGHDAAYPLDGAYVLTQDLDASATSSWNAEAGFSPIGTHDAGNPGASFTGTFDGQGHTVWFLTVNRTGSSYVGLFGSIGAAGHVQDLRINESQIKGNEYTGGLAGRNEGLIENCAVKGGLATGTSYLGGLVGANAGTAANSFATIETRGTIACIGGLVGQNDMTVRQSFSTGTVIGDDSTGGLVGANTGAIDDCYAAGRVFGGVAPAKVGGLSGSNTGAVTASFWDIESSGMATSAGGTGATTKAMQTAVTYTEAGWDFTSTWGIIESCAYPYIATIAVPVQIDTLVKLQGIGLTHPIDGDYVLANDIDASGAAFTPIGDSTVLGDSAGFRGRFFGMGRVITGLHGTWAGGPGMGLFSVIQDGAVVRDLRLLNCSITGAENTGAIAGLNFGSIIGCESSGTIHGMSYVGGMVGYDVGVALRDCTSSATVIATGDFAGGFVGETFAKSEISGCRASGAVSGTNIVGGFAGFMQCNVARCRATGSATAAGGGAGGFAGLLVGGNARECYATGDASSTGNVGGFVSENQGYMTACYATGRAVTTSGYAGGLAGIVSGTVSQCYATGYASGTVATGGLAAATVGSITGSAWDVETSGLATSAGGVGFTTAQMMQQATFAGWDFANYWGIDPGESYPYLLAFNPIRVVNPSGGEHWSPSSTQTIAWTHAPDTGDTVKIKLFKGGAFNRWITGGASNTNAFTWVVPEDITPAADYRIQIYSAADFSKIDMSDSNFTIAASPLTVTSPAAGNAWLLYSTHAIRWDYAVPGAIVKIKLYKDGAFYRWITGGTANDGRYDWTVAADLPAGAYRIQIYDAADFNIIDYSDTFSIAAPDIALVHPDGGQRFLTGDPVLVTWESGPAAGDSVKLKLFKGGAFYSWITGGAPNTGQFRWTVPSVPAGTDYRIQIYSATDFSQLDMSAANFTIGSSRLRIISPNGGNHWLPGSTQTITWATSTGVGLAVRLKLFQGNTFVSWISSATSNNGTFNWVVPDDLAPGGNYFVQIYSTVSSAIVDMSDAGFWVDPPVPIRLTYPNGGESLYRGTVVTVTWTAEPPTESVKLKLFKNGVFQRWISGGTPNDGAHDWFVPADLPTASDYKIQVYSATDFSLVDFSNAAFTIGGN